MTATPHTDPIFTWWIDANGNPWVKHHCQRDNWTLEAWRLPPPWRLDGEGITPSLNCTRCGAHQFIGPTERAPHRLWNWELPIDDLCTVCDGKPEPDPECEWCHGTGLDKEGADDGPAE